MLKETRFSPYFEFIGDFSHHYGIFSGCGATIPFDTGVNSAAPFGSCC
jgi:hypothetical protein